LPASQDFDRLGCAVFANLGAPDNGGMTTPNAESGPSGSDPITVIRFRAENARCLPLI
jgi:hypothetical protein